MVDSLLKLLEEGKCTAAVSALTITEIISILSQKSDTQTIWKCLDYIFKYFVIVPAAVNIGISAGFMKAKYTKTAKGFSCVDGVILSTAENLKSILLTYDKHFNGVSEVKICTPERFLKST